MLKTDITRLLALILGFAMALRWAIRAFLSSRRKQAFLSANRCTEAPSANRRPWLLGLDMLWESRQHAERHAYLDLLQHRFEINGNTFQSRRIGARRLATIDPANVETIVKHKAADYIVRPAREGLLGGLVGHGILTADGPLWKRHRAMMKPSFYKKRLEDFRVHEQHFQRLLACIPGDDGAVVDLKPLFFDFTIDTSTAHLFGYSAGMFGSNGSAADGPELANAFDRAQRACVRKFALGWMDVFMPQLQYKRDTERIRAFADRYIEQARESMISTNAQGGDCEKSRSGHQTPQNVLLDLISSIDDPEEIRAVLLNLMVAGRDTTASLLSSLWHGVSRDPDVWSKLQVEVASLGGKEPTAQSIKRLPFLRQCIDEALRCYPPIPFSVRAAARDTTLPTGGGPDRTQPVYVQEGTLIFVSLYSMHRDPAVWGLDAGEFRPSRWDSMKPSSVPAYMPFLAGPRKCLGWELAINTAAYVTARLVQELSEMRAADYSPWREELGLSVTSYDGTRVRLTRRVADRKHL